MAINFLNTVNLNKNQLNNAAIQNLAADPAGAVEGQIYYNTVDHDLKIYANGAWKEVGATSGVETLSTTKTGNSTGNPLTVLSNAVGDVTINSFAYAGGSNIGYVPSGGLVDQYMDGTGAWVDITTGDIESVNASTVNNRLGIAITTPLGPDPVVGLDIVGRTNLGTTPAGGDELLIYDTSATTNKSVTVSNLVGGFESNYDLTTGPGGTTTIRLRKTDNSGATTDDDVTISGTAGRTAMSRISASELRVDLTDDVAIVNDATIGNDLTVNGVIIQTEASAGSPPAPLNTFAGQVQVPTATAGGNAPNLAQVELLIAGVGVFQGGYSAAADPGTPNISGGSNVALDQGDYFVVTADGDITFSDTTVTVEVGDFIFANAAITASSSPASTQYTIVIADANLATAGTLTSAKRGVAGFDATTFNVTEGAGNDPGFVTLKPLANPYGAKVSLTSGDNTTAGQTTFTVDVTALFTGADARNCKVEVILDASGLTVYPEVTRNGTGDVLLEFMPQVSNSIYSALITIV